ncbi:MAG: 6-bladed beta-propeller [Gemmatimonadota bacterium]|nr:MAG: 6-bladed beta-propeller [Gemmatimonadota bacterium]
MDCHLMCRLRAVLCLGLALYAVSACAGGSDATAVQRTDSAGVEIVVSSGSDRVLEWQFQRLFELGGSDDGPESFFTVRADLIAADARGNLFVLDPQNARVVVFDANGQFLRTMGGSGGGPGELRAPGSISVSSDGEVSVFDFGKGSLVRFDARGGVENEQPFPLFPTPNLQRHFSRLRDTTLVSSSTSPMEPGDLIQSLRQIVGSDTSVLAQLRLPPVKIATFEKCGVSMPLQQVFVPELAWAAQPGIVAFGSSAEYSISFTEAGSVTRIVRREIEPMPASRELAMLQLGDGSPIEIRRSCFIDPAEMLDERGYAETIPLIRTVFLGPSGELWVQRFTVDRDAAAPIDVFDGSGAYVGTLVRESFSPVLLLPGGRVGVVETDENDVQRLVVLSIQG